MSGRSRLTVWLIAAVVAMSLVLVAKLPGLLLAMVMMTAVALFLRRSTPYHAELGALRTSLTLTCEDIQTVLDEYDYFEASSDPAALADRTLHRPQLLDADSHDEAIARFHFERHSAQRFLHRIGALINDPDLTPAELHGLIEIADTRARELRDTWLDARFAAKRLGP